MSASRNSATADPVFVRPLAGPPGRRVRTRRFARTAKVSPCGCFGRKGLAREAVGTTEEGGVARWGGGGYP